MNSAESFYFFTALGASSHPVTYHRMDVLPEAKTCYHTDTLSYAGTPVKGNCGVGWSQTSRFACGTMLRKIRMIAFEKAKNNIDQRCALSHAGVTLLVLLLAFCPVLHQGGLHRSNWDTLSSGKWVVKCQL